MVPLPRPPERRNTTATSRAAATSVNSPTKACSRLGSICFLLNSTPRLSCSQLTQPPRKVRRSISRQCRPPASMPLGRDLSRQHLQIVDFRRYFRLGNAVQELAHTRPGVLAQLLGRSAG